MTSPFDRIKTQPYSEVPLSRGFFALVDVSDLDLVSNFKWHAHKNKRTFYAERLFTVGGKQKTEKMHRLILNPPAGLMVDHINGNGLDNRRKNLRLATILENNRNRRVRITSRSGYKGVCWCKRDRIWRATAKVNGRQINIGCYATAEGAALAYDKFAAENYGEFAYLNFPAAGILEGEGK